MLQKKKKEFRVYKLLIKNGYLVSGQQHIVYNCFSDDTSSYNPKTNKNRTRAFLDFYIYGHQDFGCFPFIIILSVDEFQHKKDPLSCDISRMMDVLRSIKIYRSNPEIVDEREIIWIRYNPCNCLKVNIKLYINS